MTTPIVVVTLAAVLVLSAVLTAAVRRYALRRSVLDVPNERSSHAAPTPRGGGLAIVVAALGGIALLTATRVLPARVGLALFVGGALVASVGWIDDHRPLSARTRFAVQVLAAALAVTLLGGLPALRVGAGEVPLGVAGPALAIVGIVWLTNLYNFMDGIDGLAGGEAVLVGVAGGAFAAAAGEVGLAVAAWSVAAAAAGFLVWNWPPARIFMGDVGSGFLGFFFAVLALASERTGAAPALIWILLLGAFVFDATVTLVRRAVRRERLSAAHRKHAYQRLVQGGVSHRRVTSLVLLVGVALAVLAALARQAPAAMSGVLLAGVVLLTVAYILVERRRPMP